MFKLKNYLFKILWYCLIDIYIQIFRIKKKVEIKVKIEKTIF